MLERLNRKQDLIAENNMLRQQNNAKIKLLTEKNEKCRREVEQLETRKLTGLKVKEELATQQPMEHFGREYNMEDIKNRDKDTANNVTNVIENISQITKERQYLLILGMYALGIILHFGKWIYINGGEYSLMELLGAGNSIIGFAEGFGVDTSGISSVVSILKIIAFFSWGVVIGYAISGYYLLINKDESKAASIGILAAIVELIITGLIKVIIVSTNNNLGDLTYLVSLEVSVRLYLCMAVGVIIIVGYYYKSSADKNSDGSKALKCEKSDRLIVTNYNRLSDLRISYVDYDETKTGTELTINFIDYQKLRINALIANIIFRDRFNQGYIIRNCKFNDLSQKYISPREDLYTGKIKLNTKNLFSEEIVNVEVIVLQYIRQGTLVSESQYYVKNNTSYEWLERIKKIEGIDAIVKHEMENKNWQCICGGINLESQPSCGICRRKKERQPKR